MNNTESDEEIATVLNDEQKENLRAIFNRDTIIETDEDLLELAKLVEDEAN